MADACLSGEHVAAAEIFTVHTHHFRQQQHLWWLLNLHKDDCRNNMFGQCLASMHLVPGFATSVPDPRLAKHMVHAMGMALFKMAYHISCCLCLHPCQS